MIAKFKNFYDSYFEKAVLEKFLYKRYELLD